jgi:hypothetical protein
VLPLFSEVLLGLGVLGAILCWWQHEIDLRSIRKDFDHVRQHLEDAGLIPEEDSVAH